MNKAYRLVLALCATAATLSSCSRANYAFNPATPAYLGSQPTHTVAAAPVATPAPAVEVSPEVTVPVVATTTPEAPKAAKVVAVAPKHTAPKVVIAEQAAPAIAATTATTAPVQKPTLVQRLMLKKISKQLAKAQSNKSNAAEASQTAAKGTGLTVAIIGLVALLVGIIASSGLVITLGAIVLVVGLVLLLLGSL